MGSGHELAREPQRNPVGTERPHHPRIPDARLDAADLKDRTMNEIDRRQFIAAGSALGVAGIALASGVRTPPIRPEDKRIKKALKFGMIGQGETVLEKFKLVKACAFDGIELDAPGDWDLQEMLDAKAATGLSIPGVVLSTHWHKPFNHPDQSVRDEAKSALETAIKDCKALGGSSVLVVPAVVNESMPYEEAYERSQR
ncbi:MAG TPA: hypothetical protein DF699_12500, partial [Phycisphaerales bacterium]|nr:hypothetical protein [Phycisphaerales bacterium]